MVLFRPGMQSKEVFICQTNTSRAAPTVPTSGLEEKVLRDTKPQRGSKGHSENSAALDIL